MLVKRWLMSQPTTQVRQRGSRGTLVWSVTPTDLKLAVSK